MNLYGQDMDEATQPLESGLAWTIAWGDTPDRAFIGRTALENARASGSRKLVGLVLEGRGIMRAHMNVRFANGARSEEHTSELQSLMRISYAVFCLKKKKQ